MPGPETSAAGQAAAAAIPRLLPAFLHRFVGNPVMFRRLQPFEKSIPGLNWVNNAYTLAPSSKWALSAVPLMGMVTGSTPIEKIDVNQSGSLALTGFVWTFYALVISPQNAGSRMLAAVNLSLGVVNGYNCYRKSVYLSTTVAGQTEAALKNAPAATKGSSSP